MDEIISSKVLADIAGELDIDATIIIIDTEPEEWIDLDDMQNVDEQESTEHAELIEGFYTVKIIKENKETETTIPKTKTFQFEGIIAETISELIKKKLVKQHNKLLIVADETVAKRYNIAMMVLDVNKTLYRIGKFHLADKMSSETIIETVIGLAQEIGREGREGKAIGTLFVIGNPEELKPYSRQLIMNPFKGYEKSLLNIVHNQALDETIKNFAQLDGAIIIDNEGHLISAGTYIDVDTTEVKQFSGWGTKHLAASAITKITSAVAVLVSESGGGVKVFKNGRLVLKLR